MRLNQLHFLINENIWIYILLLSDLIHYELLCATEIDVDAGYDVSDLLQCLHCQKIKGRWEKIENAICHEHSTGNIVCDLHSVSSNIEQLWD